MTTKKLTINFGNKETTANLINMYENAIVAISDYIESSNQKTAESYSPAIKSSDIKNILFTENKYDPSHGSLFIISKSYGTIPATPIYFYPIDQLKIFLTWLMGEVSKEKKKLEAQS